jgi:hypothetical protein
MAEHSVQVERKVERRHLTESERSLLIAYFTANGCGKDAERFAENVCDEIRRAVGADTFASHTIVAIECGADEDIVPPISSLDCQLQCNHSGKRQWVDICDPSIPAMTLREYYACGGKLSAGDDEEAFCGDAAW